jgi:hypothetical protein
MEHLDVSDVASKMPEARRQVNALRLADRGVVGVTSSATCIAPETGRVPARNALTTAVDERIYQATEALARVGWAFEESGEHLP